MAYKEFNAFKMVDQVADLEDAFLGFLVHLKERGFSVGDAADAYREKQEAIRKEKEAEEQRRVEALNKLNQEGNA